MYVCVSLSLYLTTAPLVRGPYGPNNKVMKPLKNTFTFGTEEEYEFRYVGLNIVQSPVEIKVDNNHYVKALELNNLSVARDLKVGDTMSEEGQTEFRSVVGKLSNLASTTRPDICFDVKILSSKVGKATKQDLKIAVKRLLKVKADPSEMTFPDVGPVHEWVLVGHGDAGVRSMPDKTTSVGGHIIQLCNRETDRCCVLSWRSKKIKRKVVSSLAAEALAMVASIGELVYMTAVLTQIYGNQVNDIPRVVVTDAKNLEEAVKSTSLVEDPWLIPMSP